MNYIDYWRTIWHLTLSSQSTICRQHHDITHFWKLGCAFSPCRAQTDRDSMMWSFYCQTCTIFSNLFVQVCLDSTEFPEDDILFLQGFHLLLETQNTCRILGMSCSDDPQFFFKLVRFLILRWTTRRFILFVIYTNVLSNLGKPSQCKNTSDTMIVHVQIGTKNMFQLMTWVDRKNQTTS